MSTEKSELTTAQKARIERNRLKALMLKDAKLILHPSSKIDTTTIEQTVVKVQGTKYIDSGGGFLIAEHPEEEKQKPAVLTIKPAPIIEPSERPICIDCKEEFSTSYLFESFNYNVCDACRDSEDKHSLITKTEAKSEYLLADCDFDKREPPLKCIMRKNPHNNRWGSMKLYLHIQVEERALMVWGTKETLIAEKELREGKKETAKAKKYSKQMKELRMNVRSSLFDKTKGRTHTHNFGPESYNEEDDIFSHTCTICNLTESYEKM